MPVPAPRDLDRRAEQLLTRTLADRARAARVSVVLLVILGAAVVAGLAALARGSVCTVLDQQAGGSYCVASPSATPTPTPS